MQRPHGQLADFWVHTTTSGVENEDSSTTFHLEPPSQSAKVDSHLLSDHTHTSTLATAPTRGSRTRSPSREDENEDTVSVNDVWHPRMSGSDDLSLMTSSHPPIFVPSKSEIQQCRRVRTESTGGTIDGLAKEVARSAQLRLARSESELLRFKKDTHRLGRRYQDPWQHWYMTEQRGRLRRPSGLIGWPFWCMMVPIFSGLQSQIMSRGSQLIFLRPSRFDVLRAMWIDTATASDHTKVVKRTRCIMLMSVLVISFFPIHRQQFRDIGEGTGDGDVLKLKSNG